MEHPNVKIWKLKSALEAIKEYTEKVKPKSVADAESMLTVIGMTAEFVLAELAEAEVKEAA